MNNDNVDVVSVGVRVWAKPADTKPATKRTTTSKQSEKKKGAKPHRPQYTIVFDTETTVDHTQQLVFGSYRLYIDRLDSIPGGHCVEEGLFYADDLADSAPETFQILGEYVKHHRAEVAAGSDTKIKLMSRTDFVEQIIFKNGYDKNALIVGFNLPFDLTRIAIESSNAKKHFYGGISLELVATGPKAKGRYRPRIVYKALGSKRSLIQFTSPYRADFAQHEASKGQFLDLKTLGFSLTDRSGSLESMSTSFGVPYMKRDVVHGVVSPDYITYCREDVAATTALLRAELKEFKRHPITLDPPAAYSPASIGKAYLPAMGIVPILSRQPDFPDRELGYAMTAYYGGRAECRIRKTFVPVTYVDFLSMYPTVNALMGNWNHVIAENILVVDATAKVRDLLSSPTLANDCCDPRFWKQLFCFVEIVPDGDIVPVRANYNPHGTTMGIGINPFISDRPSWFALADLVTSVLLTGKVPKITQAFELQASDQQQGLKPVKLRGTVEVDPRDEDFFRKVIELRTTIRKDMSVEAEERDRMNKFLKVLANSTSYGIYAELNPQDSPNSTNVLVHDETCDPFTTTVNAFEKPGQFCFPPLAAVITAGARLMLGLLQHEVEKLGGSYAFCDTDSMGIVSSSNGGIVKCEGGSETTANNSPALKVLTFAQVDDLVEKFSKLNPYDRRAVPGSILKIEDENYTANEGRRELWCLAISAKRYVLATSKKLVSDNYELEFELDEIVKISEHGLGHLLNPLGKKSDPQQWIQEAWRFLVGPRIVEPEWLGQPALTQINVSGPAVLQWFRGMNEHLAYKDRVKPANFLLIAHPDPLDQSTIQPVAPYESDLNFWKQMDWIDRTTGNPINITTESLDGFVRHGTVRVQTYRDVLNAFWTHPEHKSLNHNSKPVTADTNGLLRQRPVTAHPHLHRIGKEGNKIDDRINGIENNPNNYQTTYQKLNPTEWHEVIVPALRNIDRKTLIKVSGLSRRAVERVLYKQVIPRQTARLRLESVIPQVSSGSA